MISTGAEGRAVHPSMVDFDRSPFVAIWETTRSCDLACRHCRAEAIPDPLPGELNHQEGLGLLHDLAEMGTPICVLSGGDPAKRPDLLELIRYGRKAGMRMATIPAATARLERGLVENLKEAGLAQMALSLDGPSAQVHDSFRNTPGTFHRTLQGARWAREAGLPLQINTTLSAFNYQHFDAIADLVSQLGVVFWEVFFLVPMGRGRDVDQLNAQQYEDLFARLARLASQVDFVVKITEAPHYRRYLLQHRPGGAATGHRRGHAGGHPGTGVMHMPGGTIPRHLPERMKRDFGHGGAIGLAPRGVNSGNGHLFVAYNGDVFPSGFLPRKCGNIRSRPLAEIYRNHAVFRQLRTPSLLKGKCGICSFKRICGGSRARAYAMTGDYLAEEPFCAYDPPRTSETSAAQSPAMA
ncbi:MAG TPA: TIGR04053 family radical SAM/SPASM domain-containing protein [Acidobacteriota bacterium]|nr:TIGR04053 family radical SAM/SPASM domain-containing protein [Acidobacteriota bacterium]